MSKQIADYSARYHVVDLDVMPPKRGAGERSAR